MGVLKRDGMRSLTSGFKESAAEWLRVVDCRVADSPLDPTITTDEFHDCLNVFGIANYCDLATAIDRGKRTGSAVWNHPKEKYTYEHALALSKWCDPKINGAMGAAVETQDKHGVNSAEAKHAWARWTEARDAARRLFHGGERRMNASIRREFEARAVMTAFDLLSDEDRAVLVRVTRGLVAGSGNPEASDLLTVLDGLPNSMEGILHMVGGDELEDAGFHAAYDLEWYRHVQKLVLAEYADL